MWTQTFGRASAPAPCRPAMDVAVLPRPVPGSVATASGDAPVCRGRASSKVPPTLRGIVLQNTVRMGRWHRPPALCRPAFNRVTDRVTLETALWSSRDASLQHCRRHGFGRSPPHASLHEEDSGGRRSFLAPPPPLPPSVMGPQRSE